MNNVTNTSLKKAGVPPELWSRAKKICNSPNYKVSRQIVRFIDGPWAGEIAYIDDYRSPNITAPIKLNGEVGYYAFHAPILPKGCQAHWRTL